MGYEAKILADSVSPNGHRLTTFEVTFPRIVLAEFNTHRQFSRNSASSRAIPVEKMIKRVQTDPFLPVYWGKNQKGMQAEVEFETREVLDAEWRLFAAVAIDSARRLLDFGVHKQIANRLLEPWLWHTVIVSATEWANFFNLRDNKMAQPEIHHAADLMHQLYLASKPVHPSVSQWHLPLVTLEEIVDFRMQDIDAVKVSAGRCARVSYLTHDGKRDPAEDVKLHDSLLASGHMSPMEHPARPMTEHELGLFEQPLIAWTGDAWRSVTGQRRFFLGNFNGWVQHRKLIPGESDIHTHRGTVA